jgi:hypothetical protein
MLDSYPNYYHKHGTWDIDCLQPTVRRSPYRTWKTQSVLSVASSWYEFGFKVRWVCRLEAQHRLELFGLVEGELGSGAMIDASTRLSSGGE